MAIKTVSLRVSSSCQCLPRYTCKASRKTHDFHYQIPGAWQKNAYYLCLRVGSEATKTGLEHTTTRSRKDTNHWATVIWLGVLDDDHYDSYSHTYPFWSRKGANLGHPPLPPPSFKKNLDSPLHSIKKRLEETSALVLTVTVILVIQLTVYFPRHYTIN